MMADLHADQFGQMHFPGITPPPDKVPVHFDAEKSAANVRREKMHDNRSRVLIGKALGANTRVGATRASTGATDPDENMLRRSRMSNAVASPWEHSVWRAAGRVEMVPTSHITTTQGRISNARVEELIKNPRTGSNPRLLPHDEIPYGERVSDTEVKVRNGNHRLNAETVKGRMFHPMRVIDSRDPDTHRIIDETRDRLADAYSWAVAKRGTRGMRGTPAWGTKSVDEVFPNPSRSL